MKKPLLLLLAAACSAGVSAHEGLVRPPREQYRVEKNYWTGPMPALPDETKDIIYLGSSPDWLMAGGEPMENALLTARKMRELFPDVQFVHAPVWFPLPGTDELIRKFQEMGGVFFQQQHAPPRDFQNLKALAPMPYNYRGDHLKSDNAVLATNPAHQEYLASKIYQGAKYGNNNFKAVDFVWPWTGRWAYDRVTVACFRDDLKEMDEGLLLVDAAGNLYRRYFWDYFEEYRGVRFEPADLGLKSWDDFEPVREMEAAQPNADITVKRNMVVFLALYHYEHLRQNQRYGRAAHAVGGIHQATYNPEDFANGGDFVWYSRMYYVGTPFIEYFGAPVNTEGAFYHLGTYRRAARASGKHLGVIHELGQGGHGNPSVSPLTQFVQTYDVISMGIDQYHNEWMEADAKQMMNPEDEYHNRRWRTFLGGAYGYKQARDDRAMRPNAPVLSITLRSVNHYMDAWNWDVKSMDSFCRYFSPIHVDAEESFPGELDALLPETKYLFYTAPYTRKQDFARISDWLAKGGRTLVTHSYIPYTADEGVEYQLNAASITQAPVPELIMSFMKFPGVTDTVIYRGENYSYADFLAKKILSPFQTQNVIAPEFSSVTLDENGISGEAAAGGRTLGKIEVPQYWNWTPEGGKVLATVAGKPLVTRLDRADGSVIVYLHVRLYLLDEPLRQAVTTLIADNLALPRLALPVAETPALLHAYQLPDTPASAAILWDRGALEERGFYAGYRPETQWTIENRYNYNMPGADGKVRYLVPEAGEYRVYQFVAGKETVVTADADRTVTLALENQLCDLFYVGKDTPEWREKLSQLKAKREVMRANVGDL